MKTITKYVETNEVRQPKCNRHCLHFNSGKFCIVRGSVRQLLPLRMYSPDVNEMW